MYIIYSSWGESAGLLGVLEGGVGTGDSLVRLCSGLCIVLRFEGALVVGFLVSAVLLGGGEGEVSFRGGFDWLRGVLSEEEGEREGGSILGLEEGQAEEEEGRLGSSLRVGIMSGLLLRVSLAS